MPAGAEHPENSGDILEETQVKRYEAIQQQASDVSESGYLATFRPGLSQSA